MSRPAINSIKLNDHLWLSECHPDSECRVVNWWIHDKRIGWNIAMREKTRDEAFVEAIEYWARHAEDYKRKYCELKGKVDAFMVQLKDPDDNDDDE